MDWYVRVKKIGGGSFGKALLVKKNSDAKNSMSLRRSVAGVSREIRSDHS